MQEETRSADASHYKTKLKMPAKYLILDLIDASCAGLFALREKGSVFEADRLHKALAEIRQAMGAKSSMQP